MNQMKYVCYQCKKAFQHFLDYNNANKMEIQKLQFLYLSYFQFKKESTLHIKNQNQKLLQQNSFRQKIQYKADFLQKDVNFQINFEQNQAINLQQKFQQLKVKQNQNYKLSEYFKMSIIQLKPEHNHPKKKQISIIQANSLKGQNKIPAEIQNLDVPKGVIKINDEKKLQQINKNVKQLEEEKQFTKDKSMKNQLKKENIKREKSKQNQDNKKQQQTTKKEQKSLNVEIIKKEQNKVNNELSLVEANNADQAQQKKSKKKKNKKILFAQEELSQEQKLRRRTSQISSNFISKYRIPYNNDHPEFMILLKQSFTPFAFNQLKQQRRLSSEGQDPQTAFNGVKQYNRFLFEQLKKRKNFHQDRIYFGVLEENQLFSDLIWREEIYSNPKKQQVAHLFNDLHLLVINDVWEGEYQIKNKQKASKDEIIYGSYKANQIRMAQSIIKQKLSNLNDQFTLDVEGQQNQPSKLSNHRKFDLSSQQTKKAEQFVKKLQQQQKHKRQRVRKIKEQQQQQEKKKQQEKKQLQQRLQEAKLQQRREMLQQKAMKRQKLKNHRQQQANKYMIFLNQHRQKTPLYKKKQEDFKAFMIKEHLRKLEQLKQVQKKKRSVSKDQIEVHQIKYIQLKQLLEQERQQMLRLDQEQAQQYQRSYYRGNFYKSIMSEANSYTISEQKKSKAQQLFTKKIQYATIVKNKFVPKVDSNKKQELQKLILDLAPKRIDDKLIAEKTKMEGQRNLERLHHFIGQLKAKGKVRKYQNPSVSMLSSQKTQKSRYVDYLNEIKTTRMKNSSSMRRSRFTSLDSSKLNRNSVGLIQIQAKHLQQQADRRSLFLKNSKNLDMREYLQKKFEVQDDYIQSAKAKLQVLRRYQFDDWDFDEKKVQKSNQNKKIENSQRIYSKIINQQKIINDESQDGDEH